jgi:hypothetical protein
MANVVPSSPILVALIMEALGSSETLVLRRATWRSIPEDGILHFENEFLCNMTVSFNVPSFIA